MEENIFILENSDWISRNDNVIYINYYNPFEEIEDLERKINKVENLRRKINRFHGEKLIKIAQKLI